MGKPSAKQPVGDLRAQLKRGASLSLQDLSGMLSVMKSEVLAASDPRFAELIGVSHPTVGRMMDPRRPGARGVAVKSWLRAWHQVNMLDPALDGYFDRLTRWAESESIQDRVRFAGMSPGKLKRSLQGVRRSIGRMEDKDEAVASALVQMGHGASLFLEFARPEVINPNQLADMLGVTHRTAKRLTTPIDDTGQGTAIETYLMLWVLMGTAPEMAKRMSARLAAARANTREAKLDAGLDPNADNAQEKTNELAIKPSYAPQMRP